MKRLSHKPCTHHAMQRVTFDCDCGDLSAGTACCVWGFGNELNGNRSKASGWMWSVETILPKWQLYLSNSGVLLGYVC